MSVEQKDNPLKGKYSLITDQKKIDELNKLPLYVAPNETDETYDKEIISGAGHDLNASSQTVGELRPIEVAVWYDDPNKDSNNSKERIHLRIINGRHRYRTKPTWRRAYYDFGVYKSEGKDPVLEYFLARGHFDMQKKASRDERRVIVVDMCERLMKEGTPTNDCCSKVVQIMKKQGISSENSIREVCPAQFKNVEMAKRKKDKTFDKTGKETKEVKKLKKVAGEKFQQLEAKKMSLENELTQLTKEGEGLKKEIINKDKVLDEVQSDLRIMNNLSVTNDLQGVHCPKCNDELKNVKVHAEVDGKTIKMNVVKEEKPQEVPTQKSKQEKTTPPDLA